MTVAQDGPAGGQKRKYLGQMRGEERPLARLGGSDSTIPIQLSSSSEWPRHLDILVSQQLQFVAGPLVSALVVDGAIKQSAALSACGIIIWVAPP